MRFPKMAVEILKNYYPYKVKEDLNKIVQELSIVNNETVEKQMSRIIAVKEFSKNVNVISFVEEYNINTTVYCTKTGQVISSWDYEKISLLLDCMSKERVAHILNSTVNNKVADHWYYTDGESLNNLCDIDPVGYFIYSMSLIIQVFQKEFAESKTYPEHYQIHKNTIWQKKKQDAYAAAIQIPLKTIAYANEMQRRYLSLARTLTVLRFNELTEVNPVKISNTEKSVNQYCKELSDTIKNILTDAVKKRIIKPELSYHDVTQLKNLYGGYSNYRIQRKPKHMTQTEILMRELNELIPNIPDHHSSNIAFRIEKEKEKQLREKQAEEVKPGFKLKFKSVKKTNENSLTKLFGKNK